jgi:hypothetical protein
LFTVWEIKDFKGKAKHNGNLGKCNNYILGKIARGTKRVSKKAKV